MSDYDRPAMEKKDSPFGSALSRLEKEAERLEKNAEALSIRLSPLISASPSKPRNGKDSLSGGGSVLVNRVSSVADKLSYTNCRLGEIQEQLEL